MAKTVQCSACGARIMAEAHYVVRIDIFADPSLPDIDGEALAETDFGETMESLIAQMQGMSAEELQDQVHRRFEYKLCPECQREFLANPLGLPRRRVDSIN